jgi:hypothetical protein
MSDYNEKKEKKGGFLSSLSGLFRGGSSAMGGASSGIGSSGGLGGLFASKAGLVGMVLGGATIVTGVGVIYNFIGPSSKPVFSPDLFQNSYYEEEASKAGQERAQARDASAADSSTLDMFKDQAKRDGLALGADGGNSSANGAAASASSDNPSADAGAPGAPGASAGDAGSSSNAPKLHPAAGFGSQGAGAGGGSGTSIPRMQGSAGLSGGIGSQFGSVYRPPSGAGKISGMTASAARVNSSPKYAVPNFNKKGAYGQAKYAGKMGAHAAYSSDGAGARTSATEAFAGQTTGTGDVSPAGGAGLGGAGISQGAALKGNDPSLDSNNSTVPKVPDPTESNPWQKYEDMAMKGLMYGAIALVITKILGHFAKTMPWMLFAAMASAAVGAIFALKVIFAGYKMYSEYGQKMMGGIYMAAGAMLLWQLWNAVCGAASNAASAPTTNTDSNGVVTKSTFGADNSWVSSLGKDGLSFK